MPRLLLLAFVASTLSAQPAKAQWELQSSHSGASLRGIDSLGGGIAWASGSNGTVLRTVDDGRTWQPCVTPPGAGDLDFRAVQATDRNHAFVLSAGKGQLSRLYRTTDGCRSWTLVLTNSDPDGFWDALRFADPHYGFILGDPVQGQFVLLRTTDGGEHWARLPEEGVVDVAGEAVFAASNSSLLVRSTGSLAFCTGGGGGPHVVSRSVGPYRGPLRPGELPWATGSSSEELLSSHKGETSGCFSLADSGDGRNIRVAVGGDYHQPSLAEDNAWTTAAATAESQSFQFSPATKGPRGYRSAVQYWPEAHVWVAVGPTGTDLSKDDGVTWSELPAGSAPNDRDWNALSLPFAVGAHGRIGRLHPATSQSR